MASFDDFWAAYPRRKGANPKYTASVKFAAAVKAGADPAHIVSSARCYAHAARELGIEGSPFVCMAQTWLYQKRWLDYVPSLEAQIEKEKRQDIFMIAKGYVWNGERWERSRDDVRAEK